MGPRDFGGKVVWRPTPECVDESRLQHFMDQYGFATLGELQTCATSDIGWSWDAVLDDLGIEFSEPYGQIVDLSGGARRGPGGA